MLVLPDFCFVPGTERLQEEVNSPSVISLEIKVYMKRVTDKCVLERERERERVSVCEKK